MMELEKIKDIGVKIQKNFPQFYLAGGTALVMKYKHRISEDLDFFSYKEFSFLRLSKKINKLFKIEKEERFIDNIDFFIEGFKVSFVFFPFKNIKRLEVNSGIKMASDYDIFLNKIYSAGRRIETKDVIDFAFLYNKYKWNKNELKKDFERKFPNQSFEIYVGAILSIEDYPDLKSDILKILNEVREKWMK